MSPHLNFSQRDLRNRSFRGQDLAGANFSGSDLRGCNFHDANLAGATFDGAIVGSSNRQVILRLLLIIGVAFVGEKAISNLLFGSLGKTAEDSTWSLILLLFSFLAAIGILTTIATRPKYLRRKHPIWWIAGLLNGAVLGFYYGGTIAEDNPRNAALGAVLGVIVVSFILMMDKRPALTRVGIVTASVIATYGFTFYSGNWAIAALSTRRWLFAMGWGCLTVVFLGLTTQQIGCVFWMVRNIPGTFFRGANLAQATFAGVNRHLTDLPSEPDGATTGMRCFMGMRCR